jgi:endonuclease/exonuclease/phosphatase family metal-dependent hydrolase
LAVADVKKLSIFRFKFPAMYSATRFRCLVVLLLACLFPAWTWAASYVYLQNNSHINFAITTRQTGNHTMDPGEWWGTSGTVAPWAKTHNVLWTNRDQGVHDGMDFFFDVFLVAGGDSIDLKVKLNGNFVGSDMWQSLSGPGFSHGWYGDRNFHTETFQFAGKTLTVKYTAYLTGGDDDILFAIEEANPWPVPASDEHTFDVLSYNVYMLTPPTAYTDQEERAAILPSQIGGYDAIILSEVFYNDARDSILLPGLLADYPYRTDVVDDPQSPEDGGVMIVSKWPITASTSIVYDSCDGSDCLAAKGAMYARIDKNGVPYHLFGTHTQAWQTGLIYRQAQLRQLRDFIDAINIPANEAVLVGGDLNVDKVLNNQGEYTAMFNLLRAEEPQYQGHPYSYDPVLNLYASDTTREYLDYVLRLSDYLAPLDSLNEVRIYRSIADEVWGYFDLSDHFAIWGHFQFPANTASVAAPDDAVAVRPFPNPFHQQVQFVFTLPSADHVTLEICDAQGRRVATPHDGWLDSGMHDLRWQPLPSLAAGLYTYRLQVGTTVHCGRLLRQ